MAQDIAVEIRRSYSAIRDSLPDAAPLAVLQISSEQTAIAAGSEADPQAVLVLAIGSEKIARGYFSHALPSPLELENAIAIVEDAIAPARDRIPDAARLCTADAVVRRIARFSGIGDAPQMVLSRAALERSFERLAAVALGRSAAQEGVPADREFAAALLILREFMHHLKFSAITIVT